MINEFENITSNVSFIWQELLKVASVNKRHFKQYLLLEEKILNKNMPDIQIKTKYKPSQQKMCRELLLKFKKL